MTEASMSAAELDEYAATIRTFCADSLPAPTVARPGVARDPAPARARWRSLAVELGASALLVPTEYGGEGATLVESGRVAEALGAELATLPYLQAGVLAPALLNGLQHEHAGELLHAIVDGQVVVVAGAAYPGQLNLGDDTVTGTFEYVVDADIADVVLLISPDSTRVVAVQAADLQITARPSFDLTRAFCEVVAIDAPCIDLGNATEAIGVMRAAGHLAIAAESAGGAQAALDLAVAYAKQRVQFGREIGSFQAIKHLLADAYVAAESAISVSRLAAAAQVSQSPDAAELLALAAFYPADQYSAVAATGIQVHGGIGFTVECAAHLYRRRAESNRHILGAPGDLRRDYVHTLAAKGDAA